MQMLDHVSLGVADLRRAALFYDSALPVLGYVRVWTDDTAVGYGLPGGVDKLAIKLRDSASSPGPGFHLALAAPSRDAVIAFHLAAISHGGRDDGAPGPRPLYGPNYFAAFVVDPDGYRIEAVIHAAV